MIKTDKLNESIEQLVNKMLEKHNIDFDFVKENPEIEGTPWFDYYTWSSEEQDQFREWAVDFLRKKHKIPKYRAEYQISFFILSYGLKTIEDDT